MEMEVTQAFMHAGRRVEPGEVIDLPPADAAYVESIGRARPVPPAKKPTAPSQPVEKPRRKNV